MRSARLLLLLGNLALVAAFIGRLHPNHRSTWSDGA
jgi:hypothetical protein